MQSQNLNGLAISMQRSAARPWAPRPWALARRALHRLEVWLRRVQRRRALRALLDNEKRFFDDIGVSRADIYREACKPFWRA